MKLIVGLGNPGKQYEKTRHNVGFLAVDALQEKLVEHSISDWQTSKKFNADIAHTKIAGEKFILAKPLTFMNASGQAVQLIAAFHKIHPDDILVVHDDKDITLGTYKFQTNRGHGGHNGIRSIIAHLGTKDFHRVRLGIKPTNEKRMENTAAFVLNKFNLLERRSVNQMIDASMEELKEQLISHTS